MPQGQPQPQRLLDLARRIKPLPLVRKELHTHSLHLANLHVALHFPSPERLEGLAAWAAGWPGTVASLELSLSDFGV